MKTPDDVMTLTEHLGELRVRIIRSALAITLGAILIVAFYDQVLDFLTAAVHRPVPQPRASRSAASTPTATTRRCSSSIPSTGSDDPPAHRQLRRADPGHARRPVADLALHRPGAARQGEALRHPVHPVVGRSCSCSAALLAYLTLGKALEFLISWAGTDVGALFQVEQVRPARRADGRRVRHRVPVPGAARVPPARRRVTPQQLIKGWRYAIVGIVVVAAVITPVGRPDLAGRPGRADDDPLLHLVPHRAALPAPQAPPAARAD